MNNFRKRRELDYIEEEDYEIYIPKMISVPNLEVISETPSVLEHIGGVEINKDGEGKYRRRPRNQFIASKVISARNNNSTFLPNLETAYYPKYRNDGTERP